MRENLTMFEPLKNRRRIGALAVLIALVLLAVLGNIFLTALYFEQLAFETFSFFFWLGLLISQPCLLSIWCALGSEKAIVRIPAAMGILFVLSAVYFKTMQFLDNSMPLLVVLVLGGLVLATTIILQIPLWLFRALTGQVIQIPSEANFSNSANQFGIKHLLISMTIAAVVVAIARAIVPSGNLDSPSIPWGQLILFLLYFVITACLLSFLSLAVVFSRAKRWKYLVLLSVFLLACPYGGILVTVNTSSVGGGVNIGVRETANMYILIGSISASIIGVLLCLLFDRISNRKTTADQLISSE